jgi:hypothetical protein
MYRLSTSPGGSSLDTAHISVFLWDAVTVYEIVGPSSTLGASALSNFVEWKTEECPESHTIPLSISEYAVLYSADDYSDTMTAWKASTGMYVPMAIQISVPVSSVSKTSPTFDLIESITSIPTTIVESGQCKLARVDASSIQSFTTSRVVYVENNANVDDSSALSVADWEKDVEDSHSSLLENNGWDRYLDSHLGYAFTYSAMNGISSCDEAYDYIANKVAENSEVYNYALRVTTKSGMGIHFYTGTRGVRSWEFNIQDCAIGGDDVTDICGCAPENNALVYTSGASSSCMDYSSVYNQEV